MIVIIGSKNPVKINSVQLEFNAFFPSEKIQFKNFEVPSLVSNQPFGFDEITKGAINRARNAINLLKENNNHYFSQNIEIFGVGIEAGFVSVPNTISGYLDFQFCAIINKNGKISIGSSSGLDFPQKIVNSLVENPENELAGIMEKISGIIDIKHNEGAVGFFSKGRITRTDITRQGIQMALIPFLNPMEYF